MNALVIVKSDFKNIFRDRSLTLLVFVPFIFLGLLKFMPPIYESYFPFLVDYRPHILSLFSILTSVMMGFILAFILLEERDQNLLPVFMVMPLSVGKLLFLRVLVIVGFGFFSSLLIISGTGLIHVPFHQAVVLALSCSLTGPSSTFIITSFARNKIEGVSYFKLFNMFLMAPVAGVFIHSKLALLFGIFPFFWIYSSFTSFPYISTELSMILALLTNALLLYGTYRLFVYRTYKV